MFMLFVAKLRGCTNVEGVVEGDDGLFRMTGEPPNSADFERLGLVIKIGKNLTLNKASFCGIVFDEIDKTTLTDPIEVVAQFGWLNPRYARSKSSKLRALLRCKALSYAHAYPGCPVIQSVAKYGLRVTRGIDVRTVLNREGAFNAWERDQILAAVRDEKKIKFTAIGMGSRLVIEEKYGLCVKDQLLIEDYFDSLNEIQPIRCDAIYRNCPSEWRVYFSTYSVALAPDGTLHHDQPLKDVAPLYDPTWLDPELEIRGQRQQ